MANHSGLADSGARLQIVPTTRSITVPQSCRVIGTYMEHNAEMLTFQCPSVIDGHDVLNCSDHFILYRNAAGDKYKVNVEPRQPEDDQESDQMVFDWTISDLVTKAPGTITFSVFFEDKDESGKVLYRFATTECKELQVLGNVGVNVSDSDDGDTNWDDVIVDDNTEGGGGGTGGGNNSAPQAVAVDFSSYDNGTFTETLADGSKVTYTVTFDESGNPININNGESDFAIVWG